MNCPNLNTKRQLLADLFEGKSSGLRIFNRQRLCQDSPLRWVIDSRSVGGSITAVDKQGNQTLMSEQDLAQLLNPPSIWIIVDHSGGLPIPDIDE